MRVKKFITALLFIAACAGLSEAAEFRDQLLRLDGIVSVDVITQSPDQSGDVAFKEKYIAWFEHPIDWNNTSGIKFLQRVEIGYQGLDNVNVVNVGGYALRTERFPIDDRVELAKMYNANFINIEYRYYGDSMPAGLSDDVPAMWEHLTNKNASNDFHNIMETLRGILSGSWVFTGVSKGGQTTNIFAYYYPDDADAYVSYVAPFCDGPEDPRLMEALFTTIGDDRFGAAKAKEYRDIMMNFMVEAVRERDYVQPRYFRLVSDNVPYGSEDVYVSRDKILSLNVRYEENLIDTTLGIWQYYDNFGSFDEVLKMPQRYAAASEDRLPYLRAMLNVLRAANDDDIYQEIASKPVGVTYVYYVQTVKENGNYRLNFKYLRNAAEAAGLTITATDEDESEYYPKNLLKPNLLKTLVYDKTLHDNIISWSQTTESNVIMIYGKSDPWYFVRLPDVSNPNVHIFKVDNNHRAKILSGMTSEDKAEATALLDSWLTHDRAVPSSSSGGCDVGFASCGIVLLALLLMNTSKK